MTDAEYVAHDPHPEMDDAAITRLGYRQSLDRTLGNFTLTAIQYSYMSVVATWFLPSGSATL